VAYHVFSLNGLNHYLCYVGLVGFAILSSGHSVHSIKLKGVYGLTCITQLISQGFCFSRRQRQLMFVVVGLHAFNVRTVRHLCYKLGFI